MRRLNAEHASDLYELFRKPARKRRSQSLSTLQPGQAATWPELGIYSATMSMQEQLEHNDDAT